MLPTSVYTQPSNTPRFGADFVPLPGWEQGGVDEPLDTFVNATPVDAQEQGGVVLDPGHHLPEERPLAPYTPPARPWDALAWAGGGVGGALVGGAMGATFWHLAKKRSIPGWAGYTLSAVGWISALSALGLGGWFGTRAARGMAGYGDYVQLPYSGYGDYVQLPYSG